MTEVLLLTYWWSSLRDLLDNNGNAMSGQEILLGTLKGMQTLHRDMQTLRPDIWEVAFAAQNDDRTGCKNNCDAVALWIEMSHSHDNLTHSRGSIRRWMTLSNPNCAKACSQLIIPGTGLSRLSAAQDRNLFRHSSRSTL